MVLTEWREEKGCEAEQRGGRLDPHPGARRSDAPGDRESWYVELRSAAQTRQTRRPPGIH